MRRIFALLMLLIGSTTLAAEMAEVNGIEIWYHTFGEHKGDPLLLNMGVWSTGMLWPEEFCQGLADQGFYVIRYDYRDTGRSSAIDYDAKPYSYLDFAHDAIGLLDHLHVREAHIVGFSMGGSISSLIAARFPERVKTLTLISTSCDFRPSDRAYKGEPQGEGWLSAPQPEYLQAVVPLMRKWPASMEEALALQIEVGKLMHGDGIPFDVEAYRRLQQAAMRHSIHRGRSSNHLRALQRREDLVWTAPRQVQAPTLIFHGTGDPIFGPDHAQALAASIENSHLVWVEGMGHHLHPAFYNQWIAEIRSHAKSTLPIKDQEPYP